ncbi:MAG: hypothetical protein A3F68_11685 [Acidobacteria bacterium RIFCSPLOWO2_12_FULL_54_10]|nr:MAG: hypothetical protein A3F68_11685 [Acidobacteria bacterium RIFCSPLOWO2_12_FULL_54_10]
MAGLYRIIMGASWALGLLSLFASIVLKLVPGLRMLVNTDSRGAIFFAIALFLCALATRQMQQTASPAP